VGQAPGFFVYVAAVFVADLMLIFMWNRQFYVVREFGIDVLRLTAFYDLNRRIFRLYPGLRRSVNGSVVLISAAFIAYALWVPPKTSGWWYTAYFDLHTRLIQWSAFLMVLAASLIYVYNLWVPRLYKTIVMGFLFYLFPNALFFLILARVQESGRNLISLASSFLFLVTLSIWIWGVVRPPVELETSLAGVAEEPRRI
ncbi:MAG: hypothetical protein HY652_06110, partial [Acidobacteria bacterium]|nr:hypothetical protein [Acidobacteriota bacterium]